jgi:hypothetical protein
MGTTINPRYVALNICRAFAPVPEYLKMQNSFSVDSFSLDQNGPKRIGENPIAKIPEESSHKPEKPSFAVASRNIRSEEKLKIEVNIPSDIKIHKEDLPLS